MQPILRSRFSCSLIAASGIALMMGGSALAQTVRVFDDAPSLEQLRSIMIPESQPGIGRTIVIQRHDTGASSTNVQRATAVVAPSANTQAVVETDEPAPAPVRKAVASV